MFRDEIIKRCELGLARVILVRDPDCLWNSCGAKELREEAKGFAYDYAADSFSLRYLYERLEMESDSQHVILCAGSYIPYDILNRLPVVDISYEALFPNLHAETLRQAGCPNMDLLYHAYKNACLPMSSLETERFIRETIWQPSVMYYVCNEYRNECDRLLAGELSIKSWFRIAEMIGFMFTTANLDACFDKFSTWLDSVQRRFAAWVKTDYHFLSGTPSKEQPFLMNQVLDHIRRRGAKAAIIVMDGMSFADFHVIRRALYDSGYQATCTGLFSFVPSITSVARQALFSGKLPFEHEKPFLLQNEEKQWREYWRSYGYQDHEIYFGKTEKPELSSYTKVAGIIINIVDDLMHSELQGSEGLYQSLLIWLKGCALVCLLKRLTEQGFIVFLTADHGNAAATAQGRFAKPSIIMENASRRAAIYQNYAGAEELDKFSVTEYTGAYMPKGYRYFTFNPHHCYGSKGERYISHGGMNIEELIVPFAVIGVDQHG